MIVLYLNELLIKAVIIMIVVKISFMKCIRIDIPVLVPYICFVIDNYWLLLIDIMNLVF